MKNEIQPILLAIVYLNAFHFGIATSQEKNAATLANQPKSQRDAVKKIIELGGDWELPSKTVLIGFIGKNFNNDSFRLLKPLVDLKHLAFFNIPADDAAFVHCKNLTKIEWLQISNCKFNGSGLKHLSNCKNLRNVVIEDSPFDDRALEILSRHTSIESLTIINVDLDSKITRKGVSQLSALKNTKNISIDLAEDPAGLEDRMRKLLPKCEMKFSYRPAAKKGR